MPADGPCGSLLELESCGGAGSRFSAIAADRKATRRSADGRDPLLNPDSGSRPFPAGHPSRGLTAGNLEGQSPKTTSRRRLADSRSD